MAVAGMVSVWFREFKWSGQNRSALLINAARVLVIITCVGMFYSPTVASITMVPAYVSFLASGQVVWRIKRVCNRPMVYWGIVFLATVFLGVIYSSVPWYDRWMDFFKWRIIIWFFLVLALFDEEVWTIRLMGTFLAGLAVGLLWSFLTAAGWITFWKGAEAVLRNNVTQGMGFAVAALVCVWMVSQGAFSRRSNWILLGLGMLFVLNMVFVTTGRSGYVVLGIGLGVMSLWNTSLMQRTLIMVGLPVVAILAFSFSPRMQDYIILGVDQWMHESESKSLTSMGVRRVFYVNTLEILQDHWMIGVGTGGFKQAYAEHVTHKYDSSDWRASPTGDPHNQYLAVFAKHGIGGLAVFLVWIIAIARDKCDLPKYRMLALAILCGWCVTSLFSSHFRTFVEGHLLMTFLGALLATAPVGSQPVLAKEMLSEPA